MKQAFLVTAMLATATMALAQPPARFDIALIQPSPKDAVKPSVEMRPDGTFIAHKISVSALVRIAFGWKYAEIADAPAWFEDLYDISAKPEDVDGMAPEDFAGPVRELLRDRFGLDVQEETRPHTVYSLEKLKDSPILRPAAPEEDAYFEKTATGWTVRGKTMAELAQFLSGMPTISAPVTDHTGLSGKFDIDFTEITPSAIESAGLQLKPEKGVALVLVVEDVHRPDK